MVYVWMDSAKSLRQHPPYGAAVSQKTLKHDDATRTTRRHDRTALEEKIANGVFEAAKATRRLHFELRCPQNMDGSERGRRRLG